MSIRIINYQQSLLLCITKTFIARNVDFSISGSGPDVFSFPSGTGNTACIYIDINNDDDFEGDHSFDIQLYDPGSRKRSINTFSSPEGPTIGAMNTTTIVIHDPEGKCTI